ncbi:hypothetical protein [Epibacterium sp. Ofav1-8]|uniref:hypothetical protein n=1 Tax=Epibacterium sp. Ofav1-8 TaxID=2917735 RepID=UPI001EF4C89B|nr:hypothetical protein [Epibacterium sp. Ofav1-8]MCG7625045.1 hypothetical protein [Epibacterium sp. Ofav1-8]
MFATFILPNMQSRRWHSGDLDDMRHAILDEDEDEDEDCDGPDGGSPYVLSFTTLAKSEAQNSNK